MVGETRVQTRRFRLGVGAALTVFALTACGGPAAAQPDRPLPPDSAHSAAATPAAASPVGRLVTAAVRCVPAPASHGGLPASGTVYFDKNQNGRQDAGEPGLPDIALFLSHGSDSMTPGVEKPSATCTDAAGHYSVTPPDSSQGYRLEVRTGWFRTQCPALTCPVGAAGDNVAAGPEWIYSDVFTGKSAHTFDVGLIPDAGQFVVNIHSKTYSRYPSDLSRAHAVDLAARFTDDETFGCLTTTNGVSCHIGQSIAQTLYIANSGLTPVSGIRAVMQLPYGETHHALQLLRSGTSPGITSLSDIHVTPATGPRAKGTALTAGNFTTITFTINGTLPPAGLIAVASQDALARGIPGTQIIGRAGVTAENDGAADTDSAFCATPAVPGTCGHVSDTHSMLDLMGDDNDSDRFNVVA